MACRHVKRTSALAILALVASVAACGGRPGQRTGTGGSGDAGGGAGGGQVEDGAIADAPALDASDAAPIPACVEAPTPLRPARTTSMLTLPIAPLLGGQPFVFGEPNAVPGGGTVVPLNFRFYISHVALTRSAAVPVPVDLVTAAGELERYGVHFFNADDDASTALRVLAPPGSYTGVTFTVGLDDACNGGNPGERKPPLTADSQMTWPHLAGYLFLRYEARAGTAGDPDAGAAPSSPDAGGGGARDAGGAAPSSPDAGDGGARDADPETSDAAVAPPLAIHMGGVPGLVAGPTVRAPGAFTLASGQAAMHTLTLDVGALFEGANAPADPTAPALPIPPFPEALAGERLRQHLPKLPVFSLRP